MTRPEQDGSTTAGHQDLSLHPERTTLAWGRTVLTRITAAAILLRWITHHGVFVLTLFALAVARGGHLPGKRARYARSCRGITNETVAADAASVLSLTTATAALGLLGLYVLVILT